MEYYELTLKVAFMDMESVEDFLDDVEELILEHGGMSAEEEDEGFFTEEDLPGVITLSDYMDSKKGYRN